MRDLFPGYYRPSEDEFKQLWNECIFSFDANVLLNTYRYTPKTARKVIEIVNLLKERIWLPNQVALEYLKNRVEVISTQRDAYDDISSKLDALIAGLSGEMGKYRWHPYVDTNELLQVLSTAVERLKANLRVSKNEHPDLMEEDSHWSEITELFSGKVGQPYPKDKLQQLYKEAEQRYTEKTPPG